MDMLSWTQKHPQNWSTLEVLDWLYYVADAKHLDIAKLRGEQFNSVTGKELCEMTLGQFIERDPEYGQQFYEMFRRHVNEAQFITPQQSEVGTDTSSQLTDLVNALLFPSSSSSSSSSSDDIMEIDESTSSKCYDSENCNQLNQISTTTTTRHDSYITVDSSLYVLCCYS